MSKRYLKIFQNSEEKATALANDEIDVNSVTIVGNKIEYGIGNGEHTISLGFNSEEDNSGSSSSSIDDSSSF